MGEGVAFLWGLTRAQSPAQRRLRGGRGEGRLVVGQGGGIGFWSPDSTRIAFAVEVEDHAQEEIYVV